MTASRQRPPQPERLDSLARMEPRVAHDDATSSPRGDTRPAVGTGNERSTALWLIQAFVILMAVLPATFVIGPLGAFGSPASIVGLLAFGLWASSTMEPDLLARRVPSLRIAMALFWIPGTLSYAVMHLNARDADEVNAADRWALYMVAWTGVILLAAEALRTREEVWRVLRMVVTAAAISATVAIFQARLSIDLTEQLTKLPLLTENSPLNSVLTRSGLARPSGTATHPIEFGCVLAMALGPALVLALSDTGWAPRRRYFALGAIALGIPLAVSRSAILTSAIAAAFWLVAASKRERVVGVVAALGLTVVVFLTSPGLLGTLRGYFQNVSSDSSISTRTDDYAAVAPFIRHSPVLGRGPMTFLPKFRILDNQWLLQVIETGVLGALALAMFFLLPWAYGAAIRRQAADHLTHQIGHTFLGISTVAIVASGTFDSFSFPTMPGFFSVYLGLAAALWALGKEESGTPVAEPAPRG